MNYVCVSGGADSTALALLLWERGEEFELLFSDTAAELPETYWTLTRLFGYLGVPYHMVSNGTFYQHLLMSNRGVVPSVRTRWCTRHLKEVPQDMFFQRIAEQHPGEPIEVAIGIRADEEHRANRKPRLKCHTFTYPLVEAGMGKKDAIALCEKHGLLSPAYQWRTNTSCFCCFFQTKMDWIGLWKNHPDLYRLAEQWEEESIKICGYGWKQGRCLKNLRTLDERQIQLLGPDEEEEPCVICRV